MDRYEEKELRELLRGAVYADEFINTMKTVYRIRGCRRCGSTYALAFTTIGLALRYPQRPIMVVDHVPGLPSQGNLVREIERISGLVGLKGVTITKDGRFLIYVPPRGLS